MGKRNHFDFVAAANHGYQVCWENRAVLIKLAGLPLAVKLGCIAAIIFLGFEDNVIRHGLVMLPAYFAEGFLVAYVIRVLYAGGDLADDVKQARHYYDDVIAAMIIYVLIKLALAFLVGMTVSALPENFASEPPAEPSSKAFMAIMMLFAFMIWAFRFMWLYVPVAMGIPLSQFLKRIESFMISLPMLGCWLACFMPPALLVMVISQFLLMLFPHVEGGNNDMGVLLVASLQGGIEVFVAILTSVAMAYGFKVLMDQK